MEVDPYAPCHLAVRLNPRGRELQSKGGARKFFSTMTMTCERQNRATHAIGNSIDTMF